MTMVAEISWDAMAAPDFESPARRAWREAVQTIAAKAQATLPACHGLVERAVRLVLAGDVQRLDHGQFQVASQSDGAVVYHLVNGACTCKDYDRAPSHWCKHRIAAGLYQRATALMLTQLAPGAAQAAVETAAAEPPTPAAADTTPRRRPTRPRRRAFPRSTSC